ncbi:TetR/AcrR family transcriptional regulator [Nonomuraea endophytica]|uniref:AcrR family transcriptional regulator n=1 Tax=Nonomuraea endophytica TaxID=714136 RepID=A0A7W8ACC2_9ACTN|nr:TetR/AcrR family transcriptional regulator [Nonomuraea endophytica]MBB5082143.1 AcrR family transcriptional regulator [Nonomuraea endophytica]
MPKVVDHDARREELIAATWRTIRRLGLAGTTTREIAKESGYAHGLLAYYFPDKDAILDAALDRAYTAAREELHARMAGRSGRDAVREVLLAALPIGAASVETQVLVLSWGAMVTSPTLRERRYASFREWRDTVRMLVRIAVAVGEMSAEQEPEEIADALVAVVDGLTLHGVMNPGDYPAHRLIATLDNVLDRYRSGGT